MKTDRQIFLKTIVIKFLYSVTKTLKGIKKSWQSDVNVVFLINTTAFHRSLCIFLCLTLDFISQSFNVS